MRTIEIPQPDERDWRYRAFEILPGALTWLILLSPLILGLIGPQITAVFVLAYLIFWLFRGIGVSLRALQANRLVAEHKAAPWTGLNQDLEDLVPHTKKAPNWHYRNLKRVEKYIGASRIKPSEVYHVVMVLFWNESRDILVPTIQSIVDSNYDGKKMILVLGYEQRGGPEIEATADYLIKKFGKHFYHAMAVMHPWPMAGEIIGKGGNATYAARELKKYLAKVKLDPMHVLVTTLDADNRPDRNYFAALTYTYCSTEEPRYASYQPVTLYLNNIWDAPAPMRVIATGNSMWNTMLALRPHMLRNFSAHSQPMAALIDTDFWSVRTIVEDGHQYWRTFFRYDGKHEVYPIFTPIYQDAVLADTYRRTLKMQFIQLRRWAWGASDIAYVGYNSFIKKNNISKRLLIVRFFRLLESHVSWSTAPLIILIAAYPLLFLHPQSYLANQLPHLASRLQLFALVLGVSVSLYISFKTLPPKPEHYRRHRTIWILLQWAYLPFVSILYGAFSAIYSQTRLMLGWYIGWLIPTEKAVKGERPSTSTL